MLQKAAEDMEGLKINVTEECQHLLDQNNKALNLQKRIISFLNKEER